MATCAAQSNKLTETKLNTTPKDFKSLLIVGEGTVETRVFFESLAEQLQHKLKDKGIDSKYYFKGNDSALADKEIKKLLGENTDAVVYFEPIDSLHFAEIYYRKQIGIGLPSLGYPTVPRYSRKVGYKDVLNIEFIDLTNEPDMVWSAWLEVDGDFSHKAAFTDIRNLILVSWKNNKLIK
jgi:hypothetical protein